MSFQDLKFVAARRIYNGSAFAAEIFPAEENVAIVLTSEVEDVLKPFLKLKQHLEAEGKNVQFLICRDRAPENGISERPSFGIEDINWNGKITNEEVLEFLKKRFQTMISFSASENKSATFIVSVATAKLKLGLQTKNEEQDLYDVSICQNEPEPEVFVEEIKKYIKILNKQAV